MKPAATSHGRKIAIALLVAFVAVLVLYRWTSNAEPAVTVSPIAAPSRVAASARAQAPPPTPVAALRSHPPLPMPTGGSSQARPTPAVFDFATLPRSDATGKDPNAERFATNDRFTEDDLQHPERYFDLAEHMPELRRPEERRDTLNFFLAYRDQLRRDLEAAESPHKREEVVAVLERYETAIQRLREIIDTDSGM